MQIIYCLFLVEEKLIWTVSHSKGVIEVAVLCLWNHQESLRT